MRSTNIVVSTGLHPPWNQGEVVVTRNLVHALKSSKITDNGRLVTYSSIDKSRFNGEFLKSVKYLEVNDLTKYTVSVVKNIFTELINEKQYEQVFLHLGGIKEHIISALYKLYSLSLPRSPRICLLVYDYGEIPAKYKKVPRTLHLLVDSLIAKLITFSPFTYIHFGRYFKTHYLPVPYVPPKELVEYENYDNRKCEVKECFNDSIIGYIGNLNENRFPYHIVLKTIHRIIHSDFKKDLKLVIVTSHTTYHTEMTRVIKDYARRLSLEKNVVAINENLNELCKFELLKCFDIFLFIPIKQPVSMDPPISVIEAMASGSVVISSEYMSLPYIIKNEVNGFILPELNVDILYETIRTIIDDYALKKRISHNAKEYISKYYYYKNILPKLERFIEGYT